MSSFMAVVVVVELVVVAVEVATATLMVVMMVDAADGGDKSDRGYDDDRYSLYLNIALRRKEIYKIM